MSDVLNERVSTEPCNYHITHCYHHKKRRWLTKHWKYRVCFIFNSASSGTFYSRCFSRRLVTKMWLPIYPFGVDNTRVAFWSFRDINTDSLTSQPRMYRYHRAAMKERNIMNQWQICRIPRISYERLYQRYPAGYNLLELPYGSAIRLHKGTSGVFGPTRPLLLAVQKGTCQQMSV